MIIVLFAFAAILGLWATYAPKMSVCQANSYVLTFCRGAQTQFFLEIVIVLLLAIAALIWTRQLSS
jgi:hypothetical protein